MKRQDASTGQFVEDHTVLDAAGQSSQNKQGRETLHVKIYSPYRSYFDEPAYSVSAVNRTGAFDILPHHHNFISLLEPCEITINSARGPSTVKISGGIMRVYGTTAVVFLDV